MPESAGRRGKMLRDEPGRGHTAGDCGKWVSMNKMEKKMKSPAEKLALYMGWAKGVEPSTT